MKYFLEGSLVALRPLFEADIRLLWQWLNDREATYFMFYGQRPQTEEQVREHFMKQATNESNVLCIILNKKNARPIGFAGLYDLHFTARSAEFRVFIGEKKFWGKGFGTEVTELLTFYGFDRLNLNRIYLGVTSENKGGVKAYEKAGFKREGILKDDIYRNSRYYDSIRMAILRDNYYKTHYSSHKKRFSL